MASHPEHVVKIVEEVPSNEERAERDRRDLEEFKRAFFFEIMEHFLQALQEKRGEEPKEKLE